MCEEEAIGQRSGKTVHLFEVLSSFCMIKRPTLGSQGGGRETLPNTSNDGHRLTEGLLCAQQLGEGKSSRTLRPCLGDPCVKLWSTRLGQP